MIANPVREWHGASRLRIRSLVGIIPLLCRRDHAQPRLFGNGLLQFNTPAGGHPAHPDPDLTPHHLGYREEERGWQLPVFAHYDR